MRMVNRTFSLPKDVDRDIHMFIKKRGMSSFVAEAIRKELKQKEDQLVAEYSMSNNDEGQIEAAKDWETTLGDGLDETNDW